jgi:hypothetical protein
MKAEGGAMKRPFGFLLSSIISIPSMLFLMLDGEFDQRVAAAQSEFGRDVVAVMFDGADPDAQGRRDLTAGLALSDQFQDAAFGGCQLFESRVLFGQRGGARCAG